jgi:hypothetical protein
MISKCDSPVRNQVMGSLIVICERGPRRLIRRNMHFESHRRCFSRREIIKFTGLICEEQRAAERKTFNKLHCWRTIRSQRETFQIQPFDSCHLLLSARGSLSFSGPSIHHSLSLGARERERERARSVAGARSLSHSQRMYVYSTRRLISND